MAGLIDEDQARDQLEQLNAVAATELDSFVAQMARLTEESGSRELQEQLVDLQNTAAAFKASLGTDGFVEPAWLANMDKLRESVRSLEFDLINTFESGNLDTIGVAMEAATQAAIAPLQRLKEQLAETFSGEDLETQVSIVDQMIDVKQAEAEFAVLEQLFNTKMDALRDVVELSDRDLGRGLITEAEAAERVKQAYAELEPEISRIAGKLQAIANESGVPELQRQVSDLKLGFENLSFEVDDATKTMVDGMLEAGDAALESGIKDFFTDIITETDSIQDAFRNLGVGILKAMQDVVTSALARQFMEMLSGSFGGGASGGGTGFFASIAGAFAGGFATGGYVRGQGTTTSDSIIARLSDKEFVQPADSVAYYGTEFMEMIRRKALPKSSAMNFGGVQVRTPTVARYSEGGFVSGSALQGTAPVSVDQGDVNVMVVRSEEEALSALRTSGGERAVLSIIKGNGSTISKYLGGA
jgi:soluble cytochrome b562